MDLWKERDLVPAGDREEENILVLRYFAAEFDLPVSTELPVKSPASVFGPLDDLGEAVLESYTRA